MQPNNKRFDINGVVLIDKPLGYSSNQTLSLVKKIFNAKKAGHTGTLDPLATGLLPICFGEATKFSSFSLESNKSYEASIKLSSLLIPVLTPSLIIYKSLSIIFISLESIVTNEILFFSG